MLAHQQTDHGSYQKTGGPGGLQNSCRLGPLRFRPDLRDQRRARRPFAADAESRQESVKRQLPPVRRQRRQAGERRVDEDSEDERPGAPEPVSHNPEHHAADGPADEENREDDAAVPADGFLRDFAASLGA